jgi:hypothetical protein
MSSNVAPPYDVRNPFVRLADSWYGQHTGRGQNADVFFGNAIGGWRPEMGSVVGDPTNAVGYFRFNTGNPTRDAIASVAANELGIDNFVKAVQAAEGGRYAEAFKEILFSAGEMAFYGALPARAALRGARSTSAAGRAFRQIPTTPTAQGFAVGSGGAGTTAATAGVPAQSRAARLGAAIRSARSQTGIRPRSRAGRIGMIAGGLATAGIVGNAMLRGTPRADAATSAAATATPEDTPRTIRDITPSGDPITDAGNAARNDVAAINRQYNNILRELQSMYQLSETDEERERLRFMLADIEAQRDAGLQAISEGYAQTVTAIRERGDITRQRTQEQAQRFSGELEGYADRTAQRMMLQNLEQQQQFRGLGSGSASPVNEWVGLMSAMAPLQQQYTQRMGDITAEGIDWMADTTSAQGQAQQADLQRLAAATRSAGIMGHQRQVADRIQRDSEALRAATLQTMMQQANANQVGLQGVDPLDRARSIESYALQGWGAGDIQQWLNETGQSGLTPGERERIRIRNERYIQEASKGTNNPLEN